MRLACLLGQENEMDSLSLYITATKLLKRRAFHQSRSYLEYRKAYRIRALRYEPGDGHGTAATACGAAGSTARLPAFQHYYAPVALPND